MFNLNRIYRLFQLINFLKARMSIVSIKHLPETNKYHFKANVQSFKAPGRFVMGFLEELQVLGSKEFVRYVSKIKNIIANY